MDKHALLLVEGAEGKELRQALEKEGYQPTLADSVELYNENEMKGEIGLVILDLDLPMITNQFVSNLKKKTKAWIIGISSQKHHPHLAQALRSDLFGVVSKPLDYGELFYCMKCVEDGRQ